MRYTIFCTANDPYVPKCVVTLLSFRQHHPGVPLHIIGTKFSSKMKHLMKYHKIQWIEINLKHKFTQAFQYPVECYYHFWGPKLLLMRGFQYSVAVDGDLWCNKPLGDVAYLAGKYIGAVGVYSPSKFPSLMKDMPRLSRVFTIQQAKMSLPRPNSGVLFYNNANLVQINYAETVAQVYQTAFRAGAPRKGDDSLLTLYDITQPKTLVKLIPSSYNHIPGHTKKAALSSIRVYHFANVKPWVIRVNNPSRSLYVQLAKAWQRLALRKCTNWQIKQFFPAFLGGRKAPQHLIRYRRKPPAYFK